MKAGRRRMRNERSRTYRELVWQLLRRERERSIDEALAVIHDWNLPNTDTRARIIDGVNLLELYRIYRGAERLARAAGLTDDEAVMFAVQWIGTPAPELFVPPARYLGNFRDYTRVSYEP